MIKFIAIFSLTISLTSVLVESWSGYQSPLVPAYFYPGPLWDEMIEIGAGIIIANPNSGPGSSEDSLYKKYIDKARQVPIDVRSFVICF